MRISLRQMRIDNRIPKLLVVYLWHLVDLFLLNLLLPQPFYPLGTFDRQLLLSPPNLINFGLLSRKLIEHLPLVFVSYMRVIHINHLLQNLFLLLKLKPVDVISLVVLLAPRLLILYVLYFDLIFQSLLPPAFRMYIFLPQSKKLQSLLVLLPLVYSRFSQMLRMLLIYFQKLFALLLFLLSQL